MKFFLVHKLPSTGSDISLSIFFFLLLTKQGQFVRGAKLSPTQIYNTQSSVKTVLMSQNRDYV